MVMKYFTLLPWVNPLHVVQERSGHATSACKRQICGANLASGWFSGAADCEIYSVEHISLAVVHPAMLLICEIYFVEHMKLICCLVIAMLSVSFVLYLAHLT